MANIIDYMDWRGDITFDKSPLNEVDGLIFSQFAYIPLEGILKLDSSDYHTIKEVGTAFFNLHTGEEIEAYPPLLNNCCKVLKKMMETERFGNLLVGDYRSDFDPGVAKQFAAVTIIISTLVRYIAFRGTDDSIAGWEEDFKTCYMMPVPAQADAAKYLANAMSYYDCKFYLGGHSKGGNLAVYAAFMEGSRDRERILGIQNYDGPGMPRKYLDLREYREIVNLVKNYNPRVCVVGLIMYRVNDGIIVESSEKGFMQHTGISWQVKGTEFVRADSYEKFSVIFDKANKSWIEEISIEDRELFVETVFKIIKEGFDSVTGLKDGFFNTATTILKSYNDIEKDSRRDARKILGNLIRLSKNSYKETKKEMKKNE